MLGICQSRLSVFSPHTEHGNLVIDVSISGLWEIFHSVHVSHGHRVYGIYTHTPLVCRFSPIRHAPPDLVWGLVPRNVHRPQMMPIWILHWAPGLLASISETEIRPWGRGGPSVLSGAEYPLLCDLKGILGWVEVPLLLCLWGLTRRGVWSKESVGKSCIGLCVGVDHPESLLRQWAQRTVFLMMRASLRVWLGLRKGMCWL